MLEERAKEVGRLIGQTLEYQAMKRAGDAVSADTEAVELMKRMEQLRVEAQQAVARGEEPSAELENQLEEVLGRIQVNAAYQHLIVAQENFDKLMYRVNAWISEGIRKGSASPIITL